MKAAIARQSHYTEDHARQAEGVLRGIFFDYSKEKAVTILHEIAEQDSIPYAMNALGQIYLKGTGVKKNYTEVTD
jgi:TPR repeat protein